MWRFTSRNRLAGRLDRLALCALPRPLDLSGAKKVLLFAPHPDDESLGCGGTLALLASQCHVKVVLVTDGSGAGDLPEGTAQIRQEELCRALNVLGIEDVEVLGYLDGAFVSSTNVEERLRRLLSSFQPNWVFLPSPLDYHRDHVRISAVLEPLCRACRTVSHVLFYEIWAPVPATHVVDITEVVGLKRAAIEQHVTALACADYLGAVEGLNRYRGLYLGRGRLAEAFWVEPTEMGRSFFLRIQEAALDLLDRMAGKGERH